MEKKMSAKKKRTLVICIVLVMALLVGVLIVAFNPKDKLVVETVKVTKQTISETLDTTGTVSANSEESFNLIDGVKVESVNASVGQTVKAGDIIATFDTKSLDEAVNEKENDYVKAQAAYKKALSDAKSSEQKMKELKSQIAQLEAQTAAAKKEQTTAKNTTAATTTKPSSENNGVTISDSMVRRFKNIAKLMGVEFTDEAARNFLTRMLSSGSSMNDVSSMLDSLNALANGSQSIDMGSLATLMTGSGTMSAEMSLIQLKAQLSILEIQSSDTVIDMYKLVADKAGEAYTKAQETANSMKNGWVASGKGIVSELNIKAGQEYEAENTNEFDISSILSSITSGGDITSMLSSFFSTDNNVGVKILYYPLVADLNLSKYDVLNVSLNQDVVIKSANDTLFDGKVSFISPVATSTQGSIDLGSLVGTGSTTTIPAQIVIENADNSVIVGTDVDVSIVLQTVENAVVAPVEAICLDGGEKYVYVYDEDSGKAIKKKVELGISDDLYYQILSGVNEGDTLIKNKTGLEDGLKVSVK